MLIFKHHDEQARLTQDDFTTTTAISFSKRDDAGVRGKLGSSFSIAVGPSCLSKVGGDCWGGRLAAFSECRSTMLDVFLRLRWFPPVSTEHCDKNALRLDFERFWLSRHQFEPYDTDAVSAATGLASATSSPIEPDHPGTGLLLAFFTGRQGHPIGWRYSKLIEVVHRIHDAHSSCCAPS